MEDALTGAMARKPFLQAGSLSGIRNSCLVGLRHCSCVLSMYLVGDKACSRPLLLRTSIHHFHNDGM